jgi:hypothetical protein
VSRDARLVSNIEPGKGIESCGANTTRWSSFDRWPKLTQHIFVMVVVAALEDPLERWARSGQRMPAIHSRVAVEYASCWLYRYKRS